MCRPKSLTVEEPVKLIFTGGFLGSGKTTALAALARDLIRRDKRVGIITNDQSENLADTLIVRQMLNELGVPVEEVVEGCFCCKFDELIDQIEKVLEHRPQILMGEPVGSCTDFVAAVANPIKIHYRDMFQFAPFSTVVDPDRVRELLLEETETNFPEEVAYLFEKQLEEADVIVLNKIDLIDNAEKERLISALKKRFQHKEVMAVSAKHGDGMQIWLDGLLSGRPGASTVLRQIDYDRYATAEAVLGWLNAALKLTAEKPFDTRHYIVSLARRIRDEFIPQKAEIGHLKFVMTSAGKSMWANLTNLYGEPTVSDVSLGELSQASLIVNARVRVEPEILETVVRKALLSVSEQKTIHYEVIDLQCFSPAYPDPPYLMRESIEVENDQH